MTIQNTRVVAPLGELFFVVREQFLHIVVDGLPIFGRGLNNADLDEGNLLGGMRRDLVKFCCQVGSQSLDLHYHDVVPATVTPSFTDGLKQMGSIVFGFLHAWLA